MTKKMNKWQLNRIGFFNFWYYRAKFIPFFDSKMVIRGSNGSGKSLTMQAILPVILDGITTNRMNSFGKTGRKIQDIMLGKEEFTHMKDKKKTGYITLELKQKHTNRFVTLLMGLQAQRNEDLNKWYAVLENERLTIDGEGFKLFSMNENKIYCFDKKMLSKELENKGQVFHSREEYQEFVNKNIFGFETIDDFDNAINSILSLRAPKLGSDTKVRAVFSMLENALPMVKDETIKELDESFKSLQKLASHLKSQREQLELLNTLDEKNKKYVEAKLAQLSTIFIRRLNDFNKAIDENKINERILSEANEKLNDAETELNQKKISIEVLNEIIERLQMANQTPLVIQESDSRKKIEGLKEQIDSEQRNINKIKRDVSNYENQAYVDEKKVKEISEEIDDMMDVLSDLSQYFYYELHAEMVKRIVEKEPEAFETNFNIWMQEISLLRRKLDEAKEQIKNCDDAKANNEKAIKDEQHAQSTYEVRNQEKEKAEKELHKQKTNYIELFNLWLQETKIPYSNFALLEVNNNLSKLFTDEYPTMMQVLEPLNRDAIELQANERDSKLFPVQDRIHKLKDKINDNNQEFQLLKNGKEETPYRSVLKKESRKILLNKGIEVKSFYETVEFQKDISMEIKNYIESALLESGIVDALISPEILELDNDIQLFPNRGYDPNILELGSTLADYLTPDPNLNSEFRTCVENILASIPINQGENEARFTVRTDGRFEVGVLKGKGSSKYQSIYVGKTSREKYRRERISELEVIIATDKDILNELEEQEKELKIYINTIVNVLKVFPSIFSWKEASDKNRKSWKLLDEATNNWEESKILVKNSQVLLQETKKELHQYAVNNQINEVLIQSITQVNEARYNSEKYSQNLNGLNKLLSQRAGVQSNYMVKNEAITRSKESLGDLECSQDNHKADLAIQNKVLAENLERQKQIGVFDDLRKLAEKKAEKQSLDENIQQLFIEINNLKNTQDQYEKKISTGIAEISQNKYFMNYWREMLSDALNANNLEPKSDQTFETFARNLRRGEISEDVLIHFEKELEAEFSTTQYKLRNLAPKRTEVILGASQQPNYEQNLDRWDQIHRHQKHLRLVYELGDGDKRQKLPVEAAFLELFRSVEETESAISKRDTQIWKDVFTQTLGGEIRQLIQHVQYWKDEINEIMQKVQFSRGFTLKLEWNERSDLDEMDISTQEIVRMFNRSKDTFREEDYKKISRYFGTKIDQAIEENSQKDHPEEVFSLLKNILDYRKWFGFKLYYTSNERANWTFMSDAQFRDLSGGERGLSMYLPMLAAIHSQYQKGSPNAPYIITADEAFAGIDETNIGEMFKVLQQLDFSYILNSHNLRAEKKDVRNIITHEIRSYDKEKTVTISTSFWDGHKKNTVGPGLSEKQIQEIFGEWILNEEQRD